MIIRFDFMMNTESLMDDIIDFLNIQRNDQLLKDIQRTVKNKKNTKAVI